MAYQDVTQPHSYCENVSGRTISVLRFVGFSLCYISTYISRPIRIYKLLKNLFRKEFFPLLYLPSFVTFRFTDILRGFVAQPILWKAGFNLGFTEATVFQERNAHNYVRDFESEIPMYLHTEKINRNY